jgi:hypothetical protein
MDGTLRVKLGLIVKCAACFLLGRFLLLKKGVGINMNLMNCESGGRFDYGKYCLQISSISAVMLFVSIA